MHRLATMQTLFRRKRSDMKIDHTTYEESRRGRTNAARTSKSGKVKGFLSSHVPGHNSDDTEKRVTAWPREISTAASTDNTDITAFLNQERREKKDVQNQEKVMSRANSTGQYLPLKHPRIPYPKPPLLVPNLDRKGKISDNAKVAAPSGSNSRKFKGKEGMAELKTIQTAIKTGKIERVVPRPIPAGQEGRLAPPRGPLFMPAPTARKTKTNSSKAAEYISVSADMLDERRREITSKFRASFEHFNNSLSQEASSSSSTSSYSFHCQGEIPEQWLSGKCTDPGTEHCFAQDCRLCRKPGVEGIRGLCGECEIEFEFTGASSSDGDFKPTPPLKDRKTLSLRRDEKNGKLVSQLEAMPERPRLATNESSGKAIVVTPARQESQKAAVESIVDTKDNGITRWQKGVARAEHDRSRDANERWSDSFGDDEYNFAVEAANDLAPLLAPNTSALGRTKERRTAFYGFWDDILPDLGGKK